MKYLIAYHYKGIKTNISGFANIDIATESEDRKITLEDIDELVNSIGNNLKENFLNQGIEEEFNIIILNIIEL